MPSYNTRKPNIVMIVLDSTRVQNFSLYGYEKKTTPYLEELAEECVVYRNTISAATSTVPSHASIFTGTHVSSHQLFIDNDKLTNNLQTIAEVLHINGYYTYGVCYQDDVSPVTGLHRGFNEFHMHDEPNFIKSFLRKAIGTKKNIQSINSNDYTFPDRWKKINNKTDINSLINSLKESDFYKKLYWQATSYSDQGASSTEKKVHRFLSSDKADKPFFLFLHYDEAHLPYRAKRPYRYSFIDRRLRGNSAALVNQDRHKYFLNEVDMSEDDFTILKGLYDGTISYLDKKVYELYQYLKKNDQLDNTMIIIIGDHGDNIGEHELLSHKYCVYDTLTRVPMIIKYPQYMQRTEDEHVLVQTTDIFPTIVDMLGIEDNDVTKQLEGNSLISSKIKNRIEDFAVSELIKPFGLDISSMRDKLKKYDRSLMAVQSNKYKYIYSTCGKDEFYNLENDPNEINNIIGENSPEIEKLKKKAELDYERFYSCYKKYKDTMSNM